MINNRFNVVYHLLCVGLKRNKTKIMYIERFFNPVISSRERVLCDKEKALEHCLKYFTHIRHFSFRGDEYIKNNGKILVWNDGSKVDVDKLPNDGWGKYFSEIHNLCSF